MWQMTQAVKLSPISLSVAGCRHVSYSKCLPNIFSRLNIFLTKMVYLAGYLLQPTSTGKQLNMTHVRFEMTEKQIKDRGGMRSGMDRRKEKDSDFNTQSDKRSGMDRRSGSDRRSGTGCRRDMEDGAIERRDAFRENCRPKPKPDKSISLDR